MKKNYITFFGGLGILSYLVLLASVAGMHINIDRSIPRGIWWAAAGEIGKEHYVLCRFSSVSPIGYQRGYSGRPTFLGKQIVGVPGDTVIVSKEGVFINNVLLNNSQPRRYDSNSLKMPEVRGEMVLGGEQYFVLGEHPLSFDSRYFGPVHRNDIETAINPIITF